MKNSTDDLLRRRYSKAQSELVLQSADLPLGTLAAMVDGKSIDLEPTFQRRQRWSPVAKSALIESFLLNVPVPPVYLSEDDLGKYVAIDGKQRLQTISDFIGGRFKLVSLERLIEAEGYFFADLPEEIQNALKLKPFLRVVTLLRQSSSLLKYEVFLRLNRAGEPLNRQEIRNVAYRGPLNDALYELSESTFLRAQLKISDNSSSAFRQMQDVEFVLRFLTLRDKKGNFSGGLANEMDAFLEDHQYLSPKNINRQKHYFDHALNACSIIWGDFAFRRAVGQTWRDQFLAGMYDAQMLAVAQFSQIDIVKLEQHSRQIIDNTKLLFTDKNFEEAVRSGTNTPARITYRVDKIAKLLEAAL